MNKSKTRGEKVYQTVLLVIFTLVMLLCLYPFFYVLIVSLSDVNKIGSTPIIWKPAGFTLYNFKQVFKLNGIAQSFMVSVLRTVVGTFVTLFFTSMLAYALTKKQLVCRRFFYRFAIVSMYINAGLIPWYLTLRKLGLKNNFLVYILPYAVSAYCLILIKTYIEQISPELEESAMLDGAGYFTIFSKIIVPVSKPVLAAVVVFTAIGQWNQWTDNLLLVDNNNMQTLQYMLMQYINQADAISRSIMSGGSGVIGGAAIKVSPTTIRMTVTMVVTLPIIIVYPFMQKYFIKGIMIGAVKG